MIVSNDLDFPSGFLKLHPEEIIACAVLFCSRPSRSVNFTLAFLVCFGQGMDCDHFLWRMQIAAHLPRHDDVVQVDFHGSQFLRCCVGMERRPEGLAAGSHRMAVGSYQGENGYAFLHHHLR